MERNILTYWNIIKFGKSNYYFKRIYDDINNLIVELDNDKQGVLTVELIDVISYKCTHESFLFSGFSFSEEKLKGKIFYKVQNSSFINEFMIGTDFVFKNWEIQHLAIYTETKCVDILVRENSKVNINES